MTAPTFDPFDLSRPSLKLGEHGEYEIGDITDTRRLKLKELGDRFTELEKREDATVQELAECVGELCEVACNASNGLAEKIVDLADESKHGDEALGANRLRRVIEFVMSCLADDASVPEG